VRPTTRYAKSGDYSIAYQVVGDAPLDLVYVPGFVSHVEHAWEDPDFALFLGRLASFSRLILFDKRGTGLSDRVPVQKLPTLEERMDDVRAVMDAAGSEKAALFGVSEGGPMSMLFATTYPERISALVLYGTYAKLRTAWASSSWTSKTVYSLVICNRSFTRWVRLRSFRWPPWFVMVVNADTSSPMPELSI